MSRQHDRKLTDAEKTAWFKERLDERISVKPFESQDELIDFVHTLADMFRQVYGRGVPGSFKRRLLKNAGVESDYSEKTKEKRDWMYALMDKNKAFRENKTQLRKAVEFHFKERILGIVFDELWDEYHAVDQPDASFDVDIYGQESLFDE